MILVSKRVGQNESSGWAQRLVSWAVMSSGANMREVMDENTKETWARDAAYEVTNKANWGWNGGFLAHGHHQRADNAVTHS